MNVEQKIEYFKERVKYYFFDFFHLYELELQIEPQEELGTKATTYWHHIDDGACQITICYTNEDWIQRDDLTKEEIDRTAFHEVCESLLYELRELITRRFISEREVPNAVHRVIRRLENTVFERIKDNSK